MTPDEMNQVRPRLEAFAARMLGGLARRDQRATGELYLRGLLLDGQRKSMQPMAQRLGVDHQRLQQFITSSTWDDAEVRQRLAEWAQQTIGPDAWVLDDVGFPKDGLDSPGVARMYSGALGKTGNCQIGVSVHLVTDRASTAVDWRLFIPESWDDAMVTDPVAAEAVRRRRARGKLDDHVRHREKWRLALDMLDELIGTWACPAGRWPPTPATATSPPFGLGSRSVALAMWSRSSPPPAPTPPTRSRPSRPTAGGAGPRFPATPMRRRTCVIWRSPPAARRSGR